MAKKRRTFHRELVDRVLKRANRAAVAKRYKPRKHARLLWEAAMVEMLVLERLGVWK